MAKKITDEDIEQINELYCEIGVKSQVAKILGRSAATVSKYIIPGYVPKNQRVEAPPFDESKITGPAHFNSWDEFFQSCMLTDEEWAEMREIQKGVMI